jgi:hypothetical protein
MDEAILWCSQQSLSCDTEETPEMLRRREVIRQAGTLLRRVSGRPEPTNDPDWRRAMEILLEANPDSLAPLENQLRSPLLTPYNALGRNIHDSERNAMVSKVVRRRAELLSSVAVPGTVRQSPDRTGRLLTYNPAENVSDGASRYASKGFFDLYDSPPWDSWISFIDGELISWVPAVLVPLVQAGIDANPVDCIRWTDSRAVTGST